MQPTSPTYRYREHVRKLPKIYAVVCVLFAIFGAIMMVLTGSFSLLIAFVVVEFAVIGWWMRRLATTEITLHPEHIEFTNCSKQVRIRYDDVEKIDSGHIPYIGGWMRLKGPNETIRVTVVLEGISSLASDLKRRVDRANPNAVYDRRKLFSFLKTAAYCEQSWQRLGRAALPFLLIVCIAPTIALGFGLLATVMVLGGIAVYIWTEFALARRIARLADDVRFTVPRRDIAFEERTLISAAAAWTAIVVPTLVFTLIF